MSTVETRGSRRAAARTAILSNSSPSSGLPWASVAIRVAGRGSEARLYCGNRNMGEHQRRPQQQTTVQKELMVQRCAYRMRTYVHSSRQPGECKGRKAPSYREKPQIRSPCTQSFAQSTAAALQGRCAFRGTNKHSQAALCKNRPFDKGAVTIPLVLRKLLQSRGGYGLILEEGAAYVVRF